MILHTVRCGENVLGRDQGTTTEGGVESGIYKSNLITKTQTLIVEYVTFVRDMSLYLPRKFVDFRLYSIYNS